MLSLRTWSQDHYFSRLRSKQVMKNILIYASIILFSVTFNSFGQKVSETDFSIGINKPTHAGQEEFWVAYMPSNPIFNTTRSWYNDSHWISLRKELGFNLQYLNIRYGIGNLERDNYFTGDIVSLFADAALLAHFRITSTLAFSIGPEAEFLVIGCNTVNHSYKNPLSSIPNSSTIKDKGINRDYFNKPSYGIKARLFESNISKRATLGLGVSYLWTKDEYSNFNASNYLRLSIYFGFKKPKNELPADKQN